METVVVVVKDQDQQFEALRTSLGMLLEGNSVTMIVLNHEIAMQHESFRDTLEFFKENDGRRFSNHPANVEDHGFEFITMKKISGMINETDVVIPF